MITLRTLWSRRGLFVDEDIGKNGRRATHHLLVSIASRRVQICMQVCIMTMLLWGKTVTSFYLKTVSDNNLSSPLQMQVN